MPANVKRAVGASTRVFVRFFVRLEGALHEKPS